MTFTESGIVEKLEDERRQTGRLPRHSPEHEVSQILQEVVPIESGGSPEQARAVLMRSGDPLEFVAVWGEAASREMKLQMAMTSEKAAVRDGDDVREYGSAT